MLLLIILLLLIIIMLLRRIIRRDLLCRLRRRAMRFVSYSDCFGYIYTNNANLSKNINLTY